MSDRVTANIPRSVHKKVKIVSDLNGLKMYDVYEEILLLGMEQFKQKHEGKYTFGDTNVTVIKKDDSQKDIDIREQPEPDLKKDDEVHQMLSSILSELKNNRERMKEIEQRFDEKEDIEVIPDDEIHEQIYDDEPIEEGIEEPAEVKDPWDDVDIPRKFTKMINEFTEDSFDRSDIDVARTKDLTKKALKYIIYNEQATKQDVVEDVFDGDKSDWITYAYRGLRILGKNTEKHNKECLVHPGTGESIWWYIDDVDTFQIPYNDTENLPDDLRKVIGNNFKMSRIPVEKEIYGAGVRCARYLQLHGKGSKPDFEKEVYCDANRNSFATWYEKARQELIFLAKKTGRIKLSRVGHPNYEWLDDEEAKEYKEELRAEDSDD